MSTVALATSGPDADAMASIEQHHAELAGALAALVDRVVAAASSAAPAASAQHELVGWCRRELLPHARAEEATLYPAGYARPETRLLVTSMSAEHDALAELVDQLAGASDPARAAASATTLRTLFDLHVREENELLLPALAAAPDVSLADLLAGMHEEIGADPAGTSAADTSEEAGSSCGCGEAAAEPELDARSVPHAIRHATIFGALDAVPAGQAMVLVAPHDPLPLLAQLEQRDPGAFTTEYLERGPEAWRLRLRRRPA